MTEINGRVARQKPRKTQSKVVIKLFQVLRPNNFHI